MKKHGEADTGWRAELNDPQWITEDVRGLRSVRPAAIGWTERRKPKAAHRSAFSSA